MSTVRTTYNMLVQHNQSRVVRTYISESFYYKTKENYL